MDLLTSLLKKTHLSSSADIDIQIERRTTQRTPQDLLQFFLPNRWSAIYSPLEHGARLSTSIKSDLVAIELL
jgi:hypothetical protein